MEGKCVPIIFDLLSYLNRRRNRTQCYQAQQFLNQWWPQSPIIAAFQTVCAQVGVAQAWTTLQNLLGVPATGSENETFKIEF